MEVRLMNTHNTQCSADTTKGAIDFLHDIMRIITRLLKSWSEKTKTGINYFLLNCDIERAGANISLEDYRNKQH